MRCRHFLLGINVPRLRDGARIDRPVRVLPKRGVGCRENDVGGRQLFGGRGLGLLERSDRLGERAD